MSAPVKESNEKRVRMEANSVELATKLNKDLEDYNIFCFIKKAYSEKWSEKKWEEEIEKSPFFAIKITENLSEITPSSGGLQQVTNNVSVKVSDLFVQRCAQCHTVDTTGKYKVGPNLHGLFGRQTMVKLQAIHTQMLIKPTELHGVQILYSSTLKTQKNTIPGTNMVFAGLEKPQERKHLIAYLDVATKQS